MANLFSTNLTPSSYVDCMWEACKLMYRAGWSVVAWSDGTTAHNTGTIPGPWASGPGNADPVFPLTASGGGGAFPSGSAAGAGGFANTDAWIVLRQPKGSGSFGNYSGHRMFCWKTNDSNGASWRMTYSRSGSYVFSTTGGTQPTAGDEIFYHNSSIIAGTAGGLRFNGMANDGMDGETEPFGFWFTAWPAGGGSNPTMGMAFDPLLASSVHPLDVEPFIGYAQGTSNAYSCQDANGFFGNCQGDAPYTYIRYGYSDQIATRVSALTYYSYNVRTLPGRGDSPPGSNPYNNFDDLFPVIYSRRANAGSACGYRGISSLFKVFSGVHALSGDVFTLNSSRDKIILADVVADWDGSSPLL
jgi:hypothetical protein